ncbi:hypothetical protein TYRP_022679 [Tyrophagus putrescentiae]|nr:hypothetical protein TYRP_022679 [Tyrophagus putrescentiae]
MAPRTAGPRSHRKLQNTFVSPFFLFFFFFTTTFIPPTFSQTLSPSLSPLSPHSNCSADVDCPAHSICNFTSFSCVCGLGTELVVQNGTTTANFSCSVVPCSTDAECTARFGGHVICFKRGRSGGTSGSGSGSFCGCHEPIWSLDHDSQRCLAGRVLLLDIFTGTLVVFAAIGAFAVVWIVMRAICCLKRGEYFELQEME